MPWVLAVRITARVTGTGRAADCGLDVAEPGRRLSEGSGQAAPRHGRPCSGRRPVGAQRRAPLCALLSLGEGVCSPLPPGVCPGLVRSGGWGAPSAGLSRPTLLAEKHKPLGAQRLGVDM